MRFTVFVLALLATSALAQPRADVIETLRPALYAASLGESLDILARSNHDPDDPATAGFARDVMEPRVLAVYARGTSLAEAKAFAAWTRRPDVAPFLAMERRTGDPAYLATVDAYFESNDLDTERDDAVVEFLDALGYAEYATLISLYNLAALSLMMEMAEEDAVPTGERLSEIVIELDTLRGDAIFEAVFDHLADIYYVAFAKAEVADIERYTVAVREAPGQWYAEKMPLAMLGAYGAALIGEGRAE